MNLINLGASKAAFKVNNSSLKKSNKDTLELGNIVNATILEKDDKNKTVTLSTDKYKFTVSSDNIQGNLYDSVDLQVVGLKDNTISFKQINNSVKSNFQKQEISKSSNTLDMFKDNNLIKDPKNDNTNNDSDKEKAAESLREISQKLQYSSSNNCESAISELLNSGVNLNKISLSMLSDAMSKIQSVPLKDVSKDDVNVQMSKFEELSSSEKVVTSLLKAKLPVNESNIKAVIKNLDKLNTIKNSDIPVFSVIKDESDITLNSLYLKKFTSKNKDVDTKNIKLDSEIKSQLKSNNVPQTKENIDLSKKFIAHGIPVNGENIEKYNFLTNDLKNVSDDFVIGKTIDNIKNPQPSEIDLRTYDEIKTFNTNYSNNLQSIDLLSKAQPANLNYLVDNNEPINLKNIKNSVENNLISKNVQNDTSFRQNLAEVQLKLTNEVAYSLAKKGIDIDTKPLIDVLNDLKNVEREGYDRTLQVFKVPTTEKNSNLMMEFQQKFANFNNIPANVYKDVIEKDTPYNVNGIYESSQKARALKNYDLLKTNVNPKYNDGFSKIKDKIAPLLTQNNIEATDDNVASAEILVRNNMDVTPENLGKTKELYLKLNRLSENLHPNIVANMIGDEINPLETNIDDMLTYTEKFQDVYGHNVSDKISKYIVDMSKDKSVDETNLSAVKSVYRALNQILKNNGKAIGTFINSGHNLTIENLLNTSKFANRATDKKVDVFVDDDTLITKTDNSKTIKAMVDKAIGENTANNSLEKEILHSFANVANPNNLNKYINDNPNYTNELIEKATDEMSNYPPIDPNNLQNIDDITNYVNNALNTPADLISFLQNGLGDTLENIIGLKKNLNEEKDNIKKLKENTDVEKIPEISGEDLQNIAKSGYTPNIDVLIGDLSNKIFTSNADIDAKSDLMNYLNFSNKMNSSPNAYYSTPIKLPLSKEGTFLNMYVVDENFQNNDVKNIVFSLDTEKLGNLQATVKLDDKENKVDIDISVENEDVKNHLQSNFATLKNHLNDLGFNADNINIEVKDNTPLFSQTVLGTRS